jgi:hypothetical protein
MLKRAGDSNKKPHAFCERQRKATRGTPPLFPTRVGHPELFLPKQFGLTPCTSKKARGCAAPSFFLSQRQYFSGGPDFFQGVSGTFFFFFLLPVVSHSYNVAEQVKESVQIPKTALAIKKTKMPINKLSARTELKLAGRNYSSP